MSKWKHDVDGDLRHPDWAFTPDGDYSPKGTKISVDGDLILPKIDLSGLTPEQARKILKKIR